MSVDRSIIPATARDLVVAGALLSILVNPLLIFAAARLASWLEAPSGGAKPES